jgi:DNA-binding transcriptional ArsR family regulator
MEKYAIALLLCLSLASAGWVAQIMEPNASLDAKLGAMLLPNATVSSEGLLYKGVYGNYMVSAASQNSTLSVVMSGEEEGIPMLQMEMDYLAANNVLKTSCKDFLTYNVTRSGYEGCSGKSLAFYCPSCEIAYPEAEVPKAAGGAAEIQPDEQPVLPQIALPSISNVAQKSADASGMAYSRECINEDGSQKLECAPAGKPAGFGLEQVLQLFAAFLAVVVVAYLLLQMFHVRAAPVHEEPLDPQALELMRNPTRQGILHELESADKIPTDISHRLKKSKASVVEHLGTLVDAGLVERLETPGKKFVYYRLTKKGRQILLRMA